MEREQGNLETGGEKAKTVSSQDGMCLNMMGGISIQIDYQGSETFYYLGILFHLHILRS